MQKKARKPELLKVIHGYFFQIEYSVIEFFLSFFLPRHRDRRGEAHLESVGPDRLATFGAILKSDLPGRSLYLSMLILLMRG